MRRPPRPCSVCGAPVHRSGRCKQHYRQSEKRRGNSSERGYGAEHRECFRDVVLKRDPICVECDTMQSSHADHYPHTRRQLVRMGLDPNDPRYGRGLCQSCHNSWTASQPRS